MTSLRRGPDNEPTPPAGAIAMLRSLLPEAERDEVEAEVREEFSMRCRRDGAAEANAWVWRQATGSAPSLLRRSWWRGWNGFESQGNANRPGGTMIEQWIQDTRFAMRRLRKRPLFAVLAIMTLALGVGGTAAVYSLVRTLLLSPLPYRDEAKLASFWSPYDWSQSEYVFLRDKHAGFTGLAFYTQMDLTLAVGDGATKSVPSVLPSANLFDVLGVHALMGRTLQKGDDVSGAPSVLVLSYGLWKELGSDPAMVGKPVRLGGENHTVVGVMPPGFWFPDPRARLWVNSPFNPDNRSGNYAVIGRIEDGHTFESMGDPLKRMASILKERYNYNPQWDKSRNPVITPVRDAFAGTVKPMLLATLAAMALILLIACSNVAALMLGQVDSRSTELAVRSALGANRRQLLQQLIIETVVLGLSAGLVGAMLAALSFNALTQSLPLGALLDNAKLDWSVFSGAMIISLVAALIVAAAPAISLWRGDLRDSLTRGRTSGIGARGGLTENALVIVEVALAVLLVAGAALLIRTVVNLKSIDAGVSTENVAVLDVITEYTTPTADRIRIMNELLPVLAALPGVASAGVTQHLPLRGSGDNWGFFVEGQEPAPGQSQTTAFRQVSPDYMQAMGMKIVRGRGFTQADATSADTVIILNEAAAEKFLPGVDPIGRRVSNSSNGFSRVIGVVANAAEAQLTEMNTPARYILTSHIGYSSLTRTVVLRTKPGIDPASVLDVARKTIESTAPTLAVEETTTMKNVFEQAVGPALQLMGLLIILGGLALLLGAIGVYGVVSHFVSKRKREWSIRLALGLRPSSLIAQIVTRGGTLVTIGAVLGIIAAMAMMRVLVTFLYEVKPADSTSLLGATLTLIVAGMIAALIPAWRASRVDPATVLREQ